MQKFQVSESVQPVRISSGEVVAVTFLVDYTYVNEPIPTKIGARFDIPGRGKYVEFEFTHPDRWPLIVGIGSSAIEDGKASSKVDN